MSGDWQQFRSGAEVPSLSFTARRRGIQRELPSTLTNGQKVGRIFQRKIFHGLATFSSVGLVRGDITAPIRVAVFATQGKCRVLKALHDSVDAKVYCAFG